MGRGPSKNPKGFDFEMFRERLFDAPCPSYGDLWERCAVGVFLNIMVNQKRCTRARVADLLETAGRSSARRALYALLKKDPGGAKQRLFVADLVAFAQVLKMSVAALAELIDYTIRDTRSDRERLQRSLPDCLPEQ